MSRKKRRTYSAEFKLDTVMEGLQGKKSIAQICRERGIKDSLYYKWRDIFLERAEKIFASPGSKESQEKAERIAELERMVGKLAMENEVLKKAKNWLD
jgi:transposase-like protein